MGLTKAQLTQKSISKMIDFIETEGRRTDLGYVWNKHSIVVQDMCVDGAVYDGETVWFGDFTGQSFKKRKNISEVFHRSFIDSCLEDMKE